MYLIRYSRFFYSTVAPCLHLRKRGFSCTPHELEQEMHTYIKKTLAPSGTFEWEYCGDLSHTALIQIARAEGRRITSN
jgi:hypothetical protein